MIPLLILLFFLLGGVNASDQEYGKSVLIFEDESALSIIYLQRLEKGNLGLRYLDISVENNVDRLPYQLIVDDELLYPDNVIERQLHNFQNEPVKIIVSSLHPCCEDKLLASIYYTLDDDSLHIVHQNCDQSVIVFDSTNGGNQCFSSSIQLDSHCSRFCSCSSLPTDSKCPSEEIAPMVKCNQWDSSIPSCECASSSDHSMSFSWQSFTAIAEGTVKSRIEENEVAFNLFVDENSEVQFILDEVFGRRINESGEFRIPFNCSFVLTMNFEYSEFTLRFDVSSEGEITVVYDNCSQFKMSESGDCYGGMDNGLYHFCEENGNLFDTKEVKTCSTPNDLTRTEEFTIFFNDHVTSNEMEIGTLEMDQSSDYPGMLHAIYTRSKISVEVQVKVNGNEISKDFSIQIKRGMIISIEIIDFVDNSVYGKVEIRFTEEAKIVAVVGECNQFEIESDKDPIECRAQQNERAEFCICNRLLAEFKDCKPFENPIVTNCGNSPLTEESPSILPEFDIAIYSNSLGSANYKLSWTWQDQTGPYFFRKEVERVEITGATEFHTINVNGEPGLIRGDTFTADIESQMVISLPIYNGELFVMQFSPLQEGVHLFYSGCPIADISPSPPTPLNCIKGEINDDWLFRICPGGVNDDPNQFEMCLIRIPPQTFRYDVITELNSAFPYYGSGRMDLVVLWNEQRPDYFEFVMRNYRQMGDVEFTINRVECSSTYSAVFGIGNTIVFAFLVDGKEIFELSLNLQSPIVSVIARDCEQFKLNEEKCRGELSLFYTFKFCANSEFERTHHILSCSDYTQIPPFTLATAQPFESYKMHFSFTSQSRTLKGFILEQYREEEYEIVERSLVLHWTADTDPSPFPFTVSFTTIHSQVDSTLPSYPYPIPFQVDSPIEINVIDMDSSILFHFSVIANEKSTRVEYKECDQFTIEGEDQGCYGTQDNYLCVGEDADLFLRLPFKSCSDPSTPPLSDLRAFYIYQDGQVIFTWDVMLSRNDEIGGWTVEASQAGSSNIEGEVQRGKAIVSTLTFNVEVGEETRFGVRDRLSGVIIDSFTILPSKSDVVVLYNDCTQFTMGGGDEVTCLYQMNTRICNGEPSNEAKKMPVRACQVMKFSLFNDEGRLTWSNDMYQQQFTVLPSKNIANQLQISIDDEIIDKFHWTSTALQLATIYLSPQDSFSLLPLSSNTSVLVHVCLQFQLGYIDRCYSDGRLSLCPQQHSDFTAPFVDQCPSFSLYFTLWTLFPPFSPGLLKITHITPAEQPISLITGQWDFTDPQLSAVVNGKNMLCHSTYVLSPTDSACFTLTDSTTSSSLEFSIEMEEGGKSAVKHDDCLQYYMEDNVSLNYGDVNSWIGPKDKEMPMREYRQCHSSSPASITSTTETRWRTEEVEETTQYSHSSTITTTESDAKTTEVTPTIGVDSTTTEEMERTTEEVLSTTIQSKATTSPQIKYHASVGLDEVVIHIEKSIDEQGLIAFNVTVDFMQRPKYKIYVDAVEYVYNSPFSEAHHKVGEALNVTIAQGNQPLLCIELEVYSLSTTVLELDDCPQLTLEDNVNECRSSEKICICASSYSSCPINPKHHIDACSTSSSPSLPSTERTTEGQLPSSTTSPFNTFTMETSTEMTDSNGMSSTLWSATTEEQSTPSLDPTASSFSSSSQSSSTNSNAWSTLDWTPSVSTKTTSRPKTLDTLSDLANTTLTIENVSQVLEETNAIVEIGSKEMEGVHVYYVSQILFNAANVSGISQIDSLTLLDTFDECLNAPEQSFLDSAINHDQAPQKLLQTLPLLVVNTDSERLFLSGNQMGFSSQKQSCMDEYDLKVFGLGDSGNEFIELADGVTTDQTKSSIEIPVDAVCRSAGTHSFFSIQRSTKLFLGGMNYRKLAVKSAWVGQDDDHEDIKDISNFRSISSLLNSAVEDADDDSVTQEVILPDACSSQQSLLSDQPVVSASILDNSDGMMKFVSIDEENGQRMATVTIDLSGALRPLHAKLSLSWWNESGLSWSRNDLCQLREGQWGGKVIADCFHLTDFTLIVDGTMNDPCVCDTALIIVGYVISAISICSLFLVVLATIVNRIPTIYRVKAFSFIRDDLFRTRFHSVDVLYTISLLLFYLIFTLFHDRSVAGTSCIFFAVVSYSLLFCTVLLTLFQSYRTIATFSPFPIVRRVLSFASHQIFVCTVSAGFPFVLSSILAIVSNFFDRDDGFCWVRPDYITFAVVIPLSVLIVNGIICTILVIIRLYQEQKSQLMSGKSHLKRRIISVLIMQFTLGMPWVLQYLTLYAPTSTVFHYLFTIVNGSQGVVLLLLYLYRRGRRMVSIRRRKGATMAARGMQSMEFGMKKKRKEVRKEELEEDDDEDY